MKKYLIISFALSVIISVSCNTQTDKKELKHFPVNDLNGIVNQSGIQLDQSVSSDGEGSIKVIA